MSDSIHLPTALDPRERLKGVRVMVGNTPLLALSLTFSGSYRTIYVKAENLNLTGSIKDRMALHIVRRGYETGRLKPGDRIIEATSGNTGISFAAIGKAMGHPVTIFMPEWMSGERKALIRSFGADIRLVSSEEGGFVGSIELAKQFAEESADTFLPSQFANEDNVEAHELGTGREILSQLGHHVGVPDVFVAGVGTGGTIMGVGNCLRAESPAVKLHPVEPANSPTLSTGRHEGHHRIQGISDEFIPPIVRLEDLDEVIGVDDGDAIRMAQALASSLGLGVGISSGANLLAALQVQDAMGGDAVVATVFPDSNKKYLSTDLLGEEPHKPDHITPHVRLEGFRAMGRVCDVCFDAEDPLALPVPPTA
jgi:cysteine synthase A